MLPFLQLLIGIIAATTVLGAAIREEIREEHYKSSCTNPTKRKEWRTMSRAEQEDYICAVKCLHEKTPAITSDIVPGAVTRFEDFIGVHKVQAPYIHFVGHFLGWHRYFVWTYEQALRNECGYKGGQPYWDYTLDTFTFRDAPVFSATTAFGGDGSGTSHCVQDGPFKNWTIHIAQGTSTARQDRCLARQLNTTIAETWLRKYFEELTLSEPDFGYMSLALEGDFWLGMGLHGGGHFAVGGSASDIYTSNTEPLFYLHHTNLDRIWTHWQSANPARLKDISLSIKPFNTFLNPKTTNLPAGNVTLDFHIDLGKLGESVPIRKIMDTRGSMGGLLCYEYE